MRAYGEFGDRLMDYLLAAKAAEEAEDYWTAWLHAGSAFARSVDFDEQREIRLWARELYKRSRPKHKKKEARRSNLDAPDTARGSRVRNAVR